MANSSENESARLEFLRQLDIFNAEPEVAFNRITEVARRIFDAEGSAISLVNDKRQWFKATCGISLGEVPRDRSFWPHVIGENGVVVVEDASQDPRFQQNTLVKKEGIRFYAGVPLTIGDQLHLGTLCVTDSAPRSFAEEDRVLLAELAEVATDLVESRRGSHQTWHEDMTWRENDTPSTGMVLSRPALKRQLQTVLNDRSGGEESDENTSPAGALLLLDIDQFRQVSSSLGRRAGNQLLTHVRSQIQGPLRAGDKVAETTGGRFIVWLPSAEGEESAVGMAHQILDQVQGLVEVGDRKIYAEASMGLVPDLTGHTSLEDAIENAEVSIHQSSTSRLERLGTNKIAVYQPEMKKAAQDRILLEATLRQAVDREEFEPFYLPTVRLDTGKLIGFELLARWRQQDGSIVSPDRFLPVAEETGLIVPIGHQVIEKACETIAHLRESRNRPLEVRLSGNFSRQEFFKEETRTYVIDLLNRHDISPSTFTMEVTERVLGNREEADLAGMHRLRDLGVQIEIDDFGTGYSSLQTLLDFPVDGFKVDRGLLSGVPDDESALSVMKSALEMGERLGLTVTTEGIETPAQLKSLRELGCQLGQGFLFSRPVTTAKLGSLIDSAPWEDLWQDGLRGPEQ